MTNTRNCTEADVLMALGGSIDGCKDTQKSILNKILIQYGGSSNPKPRNHILDDILTAIQA